MDDRKPFAGGIILFAAIVAGLAWGVATGQPLRGVLLFSLAGLAVAVLLWLRDRRR